MDSKGNSVVCTNISKNFGRVVALDNISIELKSGEFAVLLGPSGCGKTTLLRIIAGLEKPTTGEVHIEGKYVNNVSPKNRDTAMVFQDYALYPYKTVFDNLAFPLQMRKVPKSTIKDRVVNAAEMLGINELLSRKPGQLSGGQKQRVAVGRAVVREPKVFLMDEPLSNLDAKLRVEMRMEILKLFERLKTTFIYVTHDQVEAMTMADRIVVMNHGVIQQIGTPRDLYMKPVNRFVAEFLGSPKMNIIPVVEEGERSSILDGIPLDTLDKNAAIPSNCRNLHLGIRPEDVRLSFGETASTEEEDGLLSLKGQVMIQEYLGDETIVHIESQGYPFAAKIQGTFDATPNTPVVMKFEMQKTHLFLEDKLLQSEAG